MTETVIFHLDASSGEDVTGISPPGDILQGLELIPGPLLDAFLLRGDTKTVVLIDEYLRVCSSDRNAASPVVDCPSQAYIYPDTPQHQDALAKALPSLHFPLGVGPHRVLGHQAVVDAELGNNIVGYSTWSFSLPPEEKIQTMVPSSKGRVASVGKVLGNRTTLYKYLNPRLFVVLTESPVSPTCGVYVVDGAKGTIVYRTTLPANGGTCDVKASLTENWLVYHYYDNSVGIGRAKGNRLVSVELYEGSQIDDKTSRWVYPLPIPLFSIAENLIHKLRYVILLNLEHQPHHRRTVVCLPSWYHGYDNDIDEVRDDCQRYHR